MPFVLDCSMTMAWIFSDEATDATSALRDALLRDEAMVPTLWAIEVANVLMAATKRSRVMEAQWPVLLRLLSALPITVDEYTSQYAFSAALPLAMAHGLSVYDAVYLELALRKNLPLATLDKHLKVACMTAGVQAL